MTSEDHNSDVSIAALRSPALPAEQVGEAAAVTAMLEVLSTTRARVVGRRTRRGITIAAVTVASLGVGGLVAAGPGFFQAAANKVFINDDPTTNGQDDENEDEDEQDEVSSTDDSSNDDQASDDTSDESDDPSVEIAPQRSETDPANTSDEIICAEGNHGQTVSSVAHATEPGPDKGQIVSQAAQSDCGKTNVSEDGGVQPDDPGNPNATTPADTRPTPTPPTNPGNGNGPPDDPGNGNGNPND